MPSAPPRPVERESPDPVTLRCLVIGPSGSGSASNGAAEWLACVHARDLYDVVVEPACATVGLTPVHMDVLTREGEPGSQVLQRLRDADVLIADVTGGDANVMYALGLRHGGSLLTVSIGEYGQLPFDTELVRPLMFSRFAMGLVTAREELVEILSAGLAGHASPA